MLNVSFSLDRSHHEVIRVPHDDMRRLRVLLLTSVNKKRRRDQREGTCRAA
jgi:hypothetical protein